MRSTVFASVAVLALGLPITTFAAGGGADPPKIEAAGKPAASADPTFAQAKAMIEAKRNCVAMNYVQRTVQLARQGVTGVTGSRCCCIGGRNRMVAGRPGQGVASVAGSSRCRIGGRGCSSMRAG